MEKKQVLIVNSGTCDAREVKEETLAGYEKVVFNCGEVLVTAESRALLNRYPVTWNVGEVLELAPETEYAAVKGVFRLTPGQGPRGKKVFLAVKGTLEVAPGSEEAVAAYAGIRVKGNILCPESMAGALAGVKLKGQMDTYPDGCILLKPTAVLDGTFALRAREGARYFAARRLVVLDPVVDLAGLAELGVSFVTREVLVAESLVRAALPLMNEEAEVTVLPDGCVFWKDDVVLDKAFLDWRGGKVYVLGDAAVAADAPLDRMEFLQVKGDLQCPKRLAEGLKAIPRLAYGELTFTAGRVLSERADLTVDRALLEGAAEGLTVRDCARVRIDADVPVELLREKLLEIRDCAEVCCTPGQRGTLELLARDVARFTDGEADEFRPGEKPAGQEPGRTVVNAAEYKL